MSANITSQYPELMAFTF